LQQCSLDEQPLHKIESNQIELKPYEFITLLADGVMEKSDLHGEIDKGIPND